MMTFRKICSVCWGSLSSLGLPLSSFFRHSFSFSSCILLHASWHVSFQIDFCFCPSCLCLLRNPSFVSVLSVWWIFISSSPLSSPAVCLWVLFVSFHAVFHHGFRENCSCWTSIHRLCDDSQQRFTSSGALFVCFCLNILFVPSDVGRKIAQVLLTQKLVACVNIVPSVESHYWWEGKIDSSDEALLVVSSFSELTHLALWSARLAFPPLSSKLDQVWWVKSPNVFWKITPIKVYLSASVLLFVVFSWSIIAFCSSWGHLGPSRKCRQSALFAVGDWLNNFLFSHLTAHQLTFWLGLYEDNLPSFDFSSLCIVSSLLFQF